MVRSSNGLSRLFVSTLRGSRIVNVAPFPTPAENARDRAAVQLNQLLDHRQTDAHA